MVHLAGLDYGFQITHPEEVGCSNYLLLHGDSEHHLGKLAIFRSALVASCRSYEKNVVPPLNGDQAREQVDDSDSERKLREK